MDLYPLKVGSTWSYTTWNGFSSSTQEVKVARKLPVAATEGVELQGPMGTSRLAWRGNTLYAEALPNTRLYKPLPILVANDPKAAESWKGTVETATAVTAAQAMLRQQNESIEIGTRRYDSTKATVSMKIGNDDLELETWYAKGIGPVRQEQRTNGKLDYKVELLSGPT